MSFLTLKPLSIILKPATSLFVQGLAEGEERGGKRRRLGLTNLEQGRPRLGLLRPLGERNRVGADDLMLLQIDPLMGLPTFQSLVELSGV